jgi:AmmeMemoRadiSam system protein B
MIRPPLVAGRFYPARKEPLLRDLEEYCTPATSSGSALGSPREANVRAAACLVPHAGYVYSGGVAGAVYAALDLPRRFVILAPDHFGRGGDFGLHPATAWETPLGRANLDTDLASRLMEAFPDCQIDEAGHAEHSLEVQLPFLQYLQQEFTFVPIAIGTSDSAKLIAFGEALATLIAEEQEPVMIVASSDMNHYESDSITRRKDQAAIDAMLALDVVRLREVLRRERNSMCGHGPAVAAITAARRLGSREARLVRYATSGDAPHADRDRVVGYAGMVFLSQ